MKKAASPSRRVKLRRSIPTQKIRVERPEGKAYVFPGRLLASASGETLDCTIGQTNDDWIEIKLYKHEIPDTAKKGRYKSPFCDWPPPHDLCDEVTRVVEVIYKNRSGKRVTESRYVEVGENDLAGMFLFGFRVDWQMKFRDQQLIQKMQAQFDFLAADVWDQL